MRTLSYRPRKTRLAGAAVLALTIAALLGGLFLLTDRAPAGHRMRAGEDPGRDGPSQVEAAQIRIEIGRDYPVELTTHCGITVTEFGGRRWKADRPADGSGTGMGTGKGNGTGSGTGAGTGKGSDRADGTAPAGDRAGADRPGADRAGADRAGADRPAGAKRSTVTRGVMRLLDVNTLRFTATDTGLVVLFRPTREPAPACA